MENPNLHKIAEALGPSGLSQRFTPEVSRLVVPLLRLVAEGHPVSAAQVEQVMVEQHIPSEVVTAVVQQMCERDGEGNIMGLVGLSQHNYAHKFQVNGRTLATWCAWDALFLPALLGQTAQVESLCPATKEAIRLTVAPERVERYNPSSTVVSIVVPQISVTGLAAVGEIWMAFCNHIHFFRSVEAASHWFSTRRQAVYFLSPEQGFQLGQMIFGNMVKYAEV